VANQLNFLAFDCFPKPIFMTESSQTLKLCVSTKPRVPREKYIPPKGAKNRRKWNFNNSIFRSYKKDTDLLMEQCFGNDIELGRYAGFVKDKKELKKIKQFLADHFREIKQVYKHFSSYAGMDRIMCISEMTITEICRRMGLGEGNPEFVNEVLLAFKNSIYTDRKFLFYQKASMARFQFVEFTVRLAQKLFFDTKQADSISQALEMFYGTFVSPEKHFKEFAKQFDDNGWKEAFYWTEEMDCVYTKYQKVMEELYRMYSGLRSMPGKPKFMALEEFKNFVYDFALFSQNSITEVPVCYNLAMMTQVDELDSERIAEMSFVEWLEAFARVADNEALPHIAKDPAEEWSFEKLRGQKIWVKTEALLQHVFKHPKLDKRKLTGFVAPSKSLFDSKFELLEDD
jgi:hypothetical protein